MVSITEHLYHHLQRTDADDLTRGLGSRVDAVLLAQVIDGLYEALRTGEDQVVIGLARPLFERLEYCSPEDIAAILGRISFRGQELDVAGLVTMLGEALAEFDGRPRRPGRESDRFDELVGDLAGLITEWTSPQVLAESEDLPGPDCAERLQSLLACKYGINVEANRG